MTSAIEAARDHIAAALRGVFGPLLHSAILKGSAVKGDFIPPTRTSTSTRSYTHPRSSQRAFGSVAGEAFFTEVFDWPRRRGEAAYHRRLAQQGCERRLISPARWRELQGPLGP